MEAPSPAAERLPRRATQGDVRVNAPRDLGHLPSWTTSLAVFAAGSALLLWLFRSEIAAAVRVWRDSETFGHAFFIFPLVLYLFLRLRDRLREIQPVRAAWVLLPITILMIVWLLGKLATLTVVQQFTFVAIWQCFFLLVFGWSVTRQAIFPLAYLYLAIPFGLSVIPLLQDVTAQIVIRLLRLTGVPVFLDGYHIEIPGGSFLIAEACSGVRYLIVCIALGILAAYLFFGSWQRRLLFVSLSVIVPIIANGIRAYGIVMIAHLSHYTLAVDVDHVVYGFVFLGLVTVCLLGLAALLRDHAPQGAVRAGPPSQPKNLSLQHRFLRASSPALAIAVVVLVHLWARNIEAPPADQVVVLQAPEVGQSWAPIPGATGQWMPDFRGMDAQWQERYGAPEGDVDLHVAYYRYQREGAEAVSDVNAVTREGSDWKLLGARRMDVELGKERLPVNQALLGNEDQAILVWYWYWIGEVATNSRLEGKLLETRALLTGGRRDAAIVAVSAKVTENVETAAALIRDFLQEGVDQGGLILRIDPKSEESGSHDDSVPLDLLGHSVSP